MIKSTEQINRQGINAVSTLFTNLGWAFREQLTSDYGIDAQAEKLDSDGNAEGKLIALQIKTGTSYFKKRGEDYVFYGEERHREYWTKHSLPVFIILHNPETGITLWQKIEHHLIKDGKDGRWSIIIPTCQTLDKNNIRHIEESVASDLSSIKRYRLALDLPLIKQLSIQSNIFICIDDWVNKTLNYRGRGIYFDNPRKEKADLPIGYAMPGYNIKYYMAVFFPWLDWEIYEHIHEENNCYEMAEYCLKVNVSKVGKAALLLENYYQKPLPSFYERDA